MNTICIHDSNIFVSLLSMNKLTSALKLCYPHLASNTMPKKTKKAKLIAQYRRKLQQLEATPIQPTVQTTYVLPKDVSKQEVLPTTIALPVNEFLGIKKDLIKTVIVICVFFSIEIILWKLFG